MRQKRQKLTSASWLRPVYGGFHNLIRFNCAPFFASCRRHRVLAVTCLDACRCVAYLTRHILPITLNLNFVKKNHCWSHKTPDQSTRGVKDTKHVTMYIYIYIYIYIYKSNTGKRWSYSCNRPWRPIGLWDVEAPIFSRQSVHRWRWVCQPYAPTALHPREDSWYSFLSEAESTSGP
jgi:hypothetical protein